MSTYFPKVRNNSHSFLQVQKKRPLASRKSGKNPFQSDGWEEKQPAGLAVGLPRVFICNKYTEIIR